MTDLWSKAIQAALALMNERAANWRRDAFTAPMRSLLDRAEEAKAGAEAISAIPRPPEADRHAAIVEAALAYSRALAIWQTTGRVALYSFEDKLVAACDAEIAAQTKKEYEA